MTGQFIVRYSYFTFFNTYLGSHISILTPNSGHYSNSLITLATTASSSKGFKLHVLYVTYP